VMDLPHSDAIFVKAYHGETAEAFCDGHVVSFAFFGGVPQSILYRQYDPGGCADPRGWDAQAQPSLP
jgi:transposase